MRRRGPPPWDLMVSVITAALALTLAAFGLQPAASMMPFFFVLMLLMPGYLLGVALFPGRNDLSGSWRAAISLGASALLALLLSIILSISPAGWNLSSLTALLATSALVLAAVAYLSRSALPRSRRFVPRYSYSQGLGSGQRAGVPRTIILAFMVLAVVIIISAFAHTAISREKNIEGAPSSGNHFTEFYIIGGNDSDHPAQVSAGSMETTIAGIINHESRAAKYILKLSLNGTTLLQKEIDLEDNQTWEEAISYSLKEPGDRQRLDFLLYKDGNFKSPYMEDCLWFNVSEAGLVPSGSMREDKSKGESEKEFNNEANNESNNGSNNETSNESNNRLNNKSQIPPATLQQTTRVMPIGSEEFNEKDKSKIREKADSAANVKKSADKPPEQTSISEIESDLPEEHGSGSASLNASVEEAVSSASASYRSDNSKENISSEGGVFDEGVSEKREKLIATAFTPENNENDRLEDHESEIGGSKTDNLKSENLLKPDNLNVDSSMAGAADSSSQGAKSTAGSVNADAASKRDVKSNSLQDSNPSEPVADGKSQSSGGIAGSGASSKDDASVLDMDREIDSWVGSRGIGKSSQGQSYESKNIKYVKKGDTSERAVLGSKEARESTALGSQSKTPLRLG